MRKSLFLVGALYMSLFARGMAGRPLQVAPQIDLARYAGKWYEIARLPNRFQRNCVSDTSATYALAGDGKISVLNACRSADGKVNSAKGTARVASKSGPNTKLKVTFFWPFYGDYWIIVPHKKCLERLFDSLLRVKNRVFGRRRFRSEVDFSAADVGERFAQPGIRVGAPLRVRQHRAACPPSESLRAGTPSGAGAS